MSDIYQAITEDNVEQMQACISGGVDINKPGANGLTPLMFAVQEGKEKCLGALIKAKADV
ncbi:hypothetical protein TVAG_124340 [Trichomonas vaginalis G3]|uniref:Uncharacterized protein n=1 Tax=Trichomonas vaginalis (strain ATCC PRA-98 / G3) TaxID=412133 RepID=A2FYQ8_TRIV3|nr:spectrin binding [Trichomonas vaginalis G3]EAX89954.1 hypothetical protein TVAG_124340 [Trichomonas vaginalis G3]KAI5523677.1 spectrin binding [Trichomonas vaginalis G3]|eukprot:XP_001302884.1 hypothetical protein [Trichomonas vaginalis G3]